MADKNGKSVYLTFDDGPLGGTDDVIKALVNNQVKGTLFMVALHATQTSFRKRILELVKKL